MKIPFLILIGIFVVIIASCQGNIDAEPINNNSRNSSLLRTNGSTNDNSTKTITDPHILALQKNISILEAQLNRNQTLGNDAKNKSNTSTICTKTCGTNEQCNNNACECSSGYKKCGGTTCQKTECCSNLDCDTSNGYTCTTGNTTAGTCTFSCASIRCLGNMLCDTEYKGCFCPEEYRYCDHQKRCIPKNNCCSAYDCGRATDSRCAATVTSAKICIDTGGSKACKYLGEGSPKEIDINNKIYNIKILYFNYTASANISVDDKIFDTNPNERKSLTGGALLYLESIKEFGGECSLKTIIETSSFVNNT